MSEQDEQVQDPEDYRTTEATFYFITVDGAGTDPRAPWDGLRDRPRSGRRPRAAGAPALDWTAIRAEVQRAFKARLKEHNPATAAWKVGETPVDRLLGKELCVLAWAIERLAPEKTGIAVRNRLALRPGEHW